MSLTAILWHLPVYALAAWALYVLWQMSDTIKDGIKRDINHLKNFFIIGNKQKRPQHIAVVGSLMFFENYTAKCRRIYHSFESLSGTRFAVGSDIYYHVSREEHIKFLHFDQLIELSDSKDILHYEDVIKCIKATIPSKKKRKYSIRSIIFAIVLIASVILISYTETTLWVGKNPYTPEYETVKRNLITGINTEGFKVGDVLILGDSTELVKADPKIYEPHTIGIVVGKDSVEITQVGGVDLSFIR